MTHKRVIDGWDKYLLGSLAILLGIISIISLSLSVYNYGFLFGASSILFWPSLKFPTWIRLILALVLAIAT